MPGGPGDLDPGTNRRSRLVSMEKEDAERIYPALGTFDPYMD